MAVYAIHSKAELDAALKNHPVVILDAFAEWCGPCRVISPVFERLAKIKSKAYYVKLDVDAVPDLAQELGIRAMPTFIFFRNGERTNQITGANPVALENAISIATESL